MFFESCAVLGTEGATEIPRLQNLVWGIEIWLEFREKMENIYSISARQKRHLVW